MLLVLFGTNVFVFLSGCNNCTWTGGRGTDILLPKFLPIFDIVGLSYFCQSGGCRFSFWF